ncbi:MAG TPA: hypothetical protein GX702_14290 [Chloroflexi bacterium]|jgi:hypothetical protein|nr:hypothetical protein [Chloroflexota bacterium]
MTWKPPKTLGLIVGLVIILTIVGIDMFLFQSMLQQDIGLNLYLTGVLVLGSLPLLAAVSYWYYDLTTLHYILDRDGLIIASGTTRYTVPMDAIERIVPGREVQVSHGFRGITWPGYLKGRLHARGLGRLQIFATEPLERQIIVVTGSMCYGISPEDPEQFIATYGDQRVMGPSCSLRQNIEPVGIAAWTIWRDRGFWLAFAGALAINLLLFGMIMGRYAGLPDRLPVEAGMQGGARIAAKNWLLLIPTIGALALVVNALLSIVVHHRERFASYLLIYASLGVQGVVWLASLGILAR